MSTHQSASSFVKKVDILSQACILSVNPLLSPVTNDSVFYNLGKNKMLANYEAGDHLQRIIDLIRHLKGTKLHKLPAPWRENFSKLYLDNNSYLNMDD